MNNQILIIFKFNPLYLILKEIDTELNYTLIEILDEKKLVNEIHNLKNYLIISQKFLPHFSNQVVFDKLPIKIHKLIEYVNIEVLKQKFNNQSKIKIGKYIINLNSREAIKKDIQLKLTEKEVNTICYLFKINKSVSIDELQSNVWGYQSNMETHTVETHIYRLRKKFLKSFNDENFIISKKDGYQIN